MNEQFSTGAQRDTQADKPRLDLIDYDWLCAVVERPSVGRPSLATLYCELHSVGQSFAGKFETPLHVVISRFSTFVFAREYPISMASQPLHGRLPYEGLHRLGMTLTYGVAHYGADNWRKGIPIYRTLASLHRHFWQYVLHVHSVEDHFGAVLFNAMAIHYTARAVAAGQLSVELMLPETDYIRHAKRQQEAAQRRVLRL
jgi:hypothetical protein